MKIHGLIVKRNNIYCCVRHEVRDKNEILKRQVQLLEEINEKLTKELATKDININNYTYSRIVSQQNTPNTINRENLVNIRNIIIKPRIEQNIEKTKEYIKKTLKPADIGVGIKIHQSNQQGYVNN